jgi:hypothetical protein
MTELIVKNTFFTCRPQSFPLTFIILPFYSSVFKKQVSNKPCHSQAVQVSDNLPAGGKSVQALGPCHLSLIFKRFIFQRGNPVRRAQGFFLGSRAVGKGYGKKGWHSQGKIMAEGAERSLERSAHQSLFHHSRFLLNLEGLYRR